MQACNRPVLGLYWARSAVLQRFFFLATELVKEENGDFFVEGQEYPIWSPYGCSEAANTLMNLMATKQKEQNA